MVENNVNGNESIDIEISTPDTYEKLPGWKGKLQAMNDAITRVEYGALYVFLGILCTTLFLQWFLRFFFLAGYIWIDELIKYSTLWSAFIGASVATSRVSHFRIDFVRLIKNRNIANRVRAVTYFMTLLFCLVFAYATFDYILTLMEFGEIEHYGFKIWPVFLVLFYFYLISGARFLLMAIFKVF